MEIIKTYHGYGGALRGDDDDDDDHDDDDHKFDHVLNANLVVADAELGRSEWAKSTMIRLIFPDELGASGSDHRSLHKMHAAWRFRGLVCDGRSAVRGQAWSYLSLVEALLCDDDQLDGHVLPSASSQHDIRLKFFIVSEYVIAQALEYSCKRLLNVCFRGGAWHKPMKAIYSVLVVSSDSQKLLEVFGEFVTRYYTYKFRSFHVDRLDLSTCHPYP